MKKTESLPGLDRFYESNPVLILSKGVFNRGTSPKPALRARKWFPKCRFASPNRFSGQEPCLKTVRVFGSSWKTRFSEQHRFVGSVSVLQSLRQISQTISATRDAGFRAFRGNMNVSRRPSHAVGSPLNHFKPVGVMPSDVVADPFGFENNPFLFSFCTIREEQKRVE